mmetsp:Transcript_54159/g.118110  ORF Transcript_54159/g.118110 Transcript_54159/m.118110 type:complete len:269 (+) Transcript_54159:201-1007(+)
MQLKSPLITAGMTILMLLRPKETELNNIGWLSDCAAYLKLEDGEELLVGTHPRDLLGHKLAKDGNHREAAVLQFLELLLPENSWVLRLEAEKGRNLSRLLGVVLLRNSELMQSDDGDNLSPAGARNDRNGCQTARNLVEVEAQARREQLVRRRQKLVRTDRHAKERKHAHAAVLDLHNTAAVEGSLVLAKPERIEDLALRVATKDRLVDATDQVLNLHDGSGCPHAHGWAHWRGERSRANERSESERHGCGKLRRISVDCRDGEARAR